jgi:hypothetical protein
MFRNCVLVDGSTSGTRATQALVDENAGVTKEMWVKNVVAVSGQSQNFKLASSSQSVGFEDMFVGGGFVNGGQAANSLLSKNVIAGSISSGSAGRNTILEDASKGIETETRNMGFLNINGADIYRDFTLYPDSWRKFAVPNPGYENAGPWQLMAELEAKRIAMGL